MDAYNFPQGMQCANDNLHLFAAIISCNVVLDVRDFMLHPSNVCTSVMMHVPDKGAGSLYDERVRNCNMGKET